MGSPQSKHLAGGGCWLVPWASRLQIVSWQAGAQVQFQHRREMSSLFGWPCVLKARGIPWVVKAKGSPRGRSRDPHSICVALWAGPFQAPDCWGFRDVGERLVLMKRWGFGGRILVALCWAADLLLLQRIWEHFVLFVGLVGFLCFVFAFFKIYFLIEVTFVSII